MNDTTQPTQSTSQETTSGSPAGSDDPRPTSPGDDWNQTKSIVTKIVDAIEAEGKSTEIHEAPPIHSVINPDALNRLFQPTRDGAKRNQGEVSFQWANHRIRIQATGTVTVHAIEEADDAS